MALSYIQYPGNGTQQVFAVPFPKIRKEDVQVRVNLEPVAHSWDDEQSVRIIPAPAAGTVVELRRFTQREVRLVDFSDGSVLTETELDLANEQVFYIVQEAIDIAGGTLELLSNGSYGAGGRRIEDLDDPAHPKDAVTRRWAESAMSSQLAQAISAMNSAVAARDAAQVSQGASAGSASASAGSASASAAQAALSDAARVAAQVARDAALTYRDSAQAYRNETLGFRNEAEGFKNSAAASAAAAQTLDPANYYTKVQVYAKTETYTKAEVYSKSETDAKLGEKASAANPSISGTVTANALTISSGTPQINMSDIDWGYRYIHHSNGTLGFLNNGGGWTFYSGNDGSGWFGGNVVIGSATYQTNGDIYMPWAGQHLSTYLGSLGNSANVAQSWANDRVHRIQMAGYGEVGGTGGMTGVQPGVFTGAAGTAYGAQTFGYRTLQMHIPSQGGWVNIWVS